MTGEFKYMVIKMKTLKVKLIYSALLTLCFQLSLNADELLAKPLIVNSKAQPIESIEDFIDPLKGVSFNLDKRVNKLNKKLTNQNVNNELILQPGQYIQIKGIDNRILLFDGSVSNSALIFLAPFPITMVIKSSGGRFLILTFSATEFSIEF